MNHSVLITKYLLYARDFQSIDHLGAIQFPDKHQSDRYAVRMSHVALWFSAVSFSVYGIACLVSGHMREEFIRYGLSQYKALVGWLQLMGAAGLVVGLWQPFVGAAAAFGLTLMMVFGIIVRIKIRDTIIQTVPAVGYMLLNAYLTLYFWFVALA